MNTDAEQMSGFFASHQQALLTRAAEHLMLTGIAVFAALILGVGLAVLAYRTRWLRVPLLVVVGLLQTIPGIALLVIAMGLFGHIGTAPALLALVLYALLPIVQNTLVGLNALSPNLVEVSRGLGLTPLQRLRYVRLPLAAPLMLAGLRIAAVQTVGLATLAAFVGAGGLGQFINRGLFLSDTRLILLGAIPAALMALGIHALLSLVTFAAEPHRPRAMRRYALCGALGMLLLVGVWAGTRIHTQNARNAAFDITIGSKNFTEQLIIAELVAQQIERHTDLHVRRELGLGGSSVVHQALRNGSIDLAVEYTGTALVSILHQPIPVSRAAVFPLVQQQYQQQFGLIWLAPLGFDNSYRLAIRDGDGPLANVHTTSDLATHAAALTAAFDFEFAERADGYAGLKQRYGLSFQRVRDMHPDLLYPALRNGSVDVISAYTTDGRLAQPGLRLLTDDLHFFPPYQAAIVVRSETLAAHPGLEGALAKLSGRMTDADMRAMNAAVDTRQLTVEQAARKLLEKLTQN